MARPTTDQLSALFIYYKIDPASAPAFERAARDMQARLARDHEGLQARLWVRSDAHVSAQTWMESYEHPQGVSPALADRIAQAAQGLPEGQIGPRHLEVFKTVD